MLVAVFGATGAIGQYTVQSLLENGHDVQALVRNPSKVPSTWGSRVTVIFGELDNIAAIQETITGTSAVISALGPSMDKSTTGKPLVAGTRNILDAMAKHGVKRFIGHATPSFHDPQESSTWSRMLIGFLGRTMFPRAYEEMLELCAMIASSHAEWTIVRFINPTDNPKTGKVKAGFYGQDSVGWALSRADIGALLRRRLRIRGSSTGHRSSAASMRSRIWDTCRGLQSMRPVMRNVSWAELAV
jgi:nucleoside-diphosphate-sugar epimerase